VEDEVDALYKLPLGEFTPARNALAARLKKGGQQAMADAAKAVPKPSVAAWVVNQLYWRHRAAFDRLIEAGDRFRQVQSAQPRNSAGVREHLEARREAQAALVRLAADVLREGGYSGTRDMMRRVTSTLEAFATYGSLPDAPQAGRLTAELEPPGFDLVAVLLPLSGETRREAAKPPRAATRPRGAEHAPKPARRKDALDAARRGEEDRRRLAAAAKVAVREAERALRAARKQAERTAATSESAATRAKDAERRRAEIEKQLAKVVTEAETACERLREAETNAQQAAQAAEGAERALGLARRRLEQLAVDQN
jgi:hypothetical protein